MFTPYEDIEHRHHTRFDELATLCKKILKKLDLIEYTKFTNQIAARNLDFDEKEKQRIKLELEAQKLEEARIEKEKAEHKERRKKEL